MFRSILILFFTCLSTFPSFSIDLKVGLLRNVKLKHIAFRSDSSDFKISSGSLNFPLKKGKELRVQYHNDSIRLKIGEKSLGHFDTVFFNSRNENAIFSISSLVPNLKERKYYSNLKAFVSGNSITIVNQIGLERYLIGVLESEVGPSQSKDFYKVHAVISRTYALKNLNKFIHEGFNLTDLVNCQVYKGKMYNNKAIEEAVNETKNLVLVDKNIDYITAAYYSNSGGQTVNVEDVWLEPLYYLRSVKDPYSVGKHNYSWTRKISKTKWLSYLKNKHNFPADNSELAKKACNFKQSYRKKYFLDWKHHILLTDIRNDFKLKSTFFSVTEHTDHVVLNGKGFGHGVGLSQEGAIQMIKLGYGFLDVLRFYYTGVHLVDLQMRNFYISD